MPSAILRSLLVKPEASFGSLAAGTALPDRTIFSSGALSMDCDRASITIPGSHAANDRDDVRNGFYTTPPDPATVLDGDGDPVRRWTGAEMTLECTVRGVGTATATDIPFHQILASGLTPLALPTNRSVTVGTEVGAQQFGVPAATAADIPTGSLLAYIPAGAAGPAAVTQVVAKASDAGTTTVDYSPALPKGTLAVDDELRQTRCYGSIPGSALGPSVAVRGDFDGGRFYGFGGRMKSCAFKSDGDRVRATIVIVIALVQPAHDEVTAGAANVTGRPYTPAGSRVLHALAAAFAISDPVDDAEAAPRVGGSTTVCPSAWEFKIENTLEAVVCWGSILGMTDMEVVDRSCVLTATLRSPIAALDDDFLLRRRRTIAGAWSPATQAAGFVIPAAFLAADAANRDLGGAAVQQAVEWRAGEPLTVTPGGGEGTDHLAGSPFVLGFALTPAS